MKTLIMVLALCMASTAFAETWKDQELREAMETRMKIIQQQGPSQRHPDTYEQDRQGQQMQQMQREINNQQFEMQRQNAEAQRQQQQQIFNNIWRPR